MNSTDNERFVELMGGIWATYSPGKELPKPTVKAYWLALKQHSYEQIEAAMTRHVQVSEWWPKPAEINNIIVGKTSDNAKTAWGWLLSAIESHGVANVQVPDDVRFQAGVNAVGGLRQIGMTSYEQLGFVQKRFEDAYQAADGSSYREESPALGFDAKKLLGANR